MPSLWTLLQVAPCSACHGAQSPEEGRPPLSNVSRAGVFAVSERCGSAQQREILGKMCGLTALRL